MITISFLLSVCAYLTIVFFLKHQLETFKDPLKTKVFVPELTNGRYDFPFYYGFLFFTHTLFYFLLVGICAFGLGYLLHELQKFAHPFTDTIVTNYQSVGLLALTLMPICFFLPAFLYIQYFRFFPKQLLYFTAYDQGWGFRNHSVFKKKKRADELMQEVINDFLKTPSHADYYAKKLSGWWAGALFTTFVTWTFFGFFVLLQFDSYSVITKDSVTSNRFSSIFERQHSFAELKQATLGITILSSSGGRYKRYRPIEEKAYGFAPTLSITTKNDTIIYLSNVNTRQSDEVIRTTLKNLDEHDVKIVIDPVLPRTQAIWEFERLRQQRETIQPLYEYAKELSEN